MVEWKKLGEIGKCMAGATPSTKESSYWDNGTIPWMSSGEVHQGVVKSTSALITQKGYDNSSTKMLPSGTVVIALAGQGKTRGTVAITAIELCTNQSLCGVVIDNDSIINKYVYYYLKTRYDDLRRISSGEGTRGGLNLKMIGSYLIPVPLLSEQKRIVGILDTFTSSIENLKEQIVLRRKQYDYYRDQLLDLEGKEGVEMKTLGLVCSFIRGPFGGALKKEIFTEEGYVIYEQQHAIYGKWDFRYHISEEKFQEMKRFAVNAGDIIMSCSGTMGKTSIVPDDYERGIINQALLKLTTNNEVNNRYIKLYMDSKWFQDGLKKQTAGGAIQNVASVSVLKNIKLPVPSISEQQRIVDILDKFEESIQNLEDQLSQREKQYEYYRNKLLTFE